MAKNGLTQRAATVLNVKAVVVFLSGERGQLKWQPDIGRAAGPSSWR
jgi:hypothetical protein